MSGQFARLEQSLYRAHPTTLNQRIEVFANDLQQILDHYVAVSTELAELKAARTQPAQEVPRLTDEEIKVFAIEEFDCTWDADDETLVNKYGHGVYFWRFTDFARAIEAALLKKITQHVRLTTPHERTSR